MGFKQKGEHMNFENLASNLNEEEKKRENQILPYCNPQQIANEIMSDLEKAKPVANSWSTPAGYQSEIGSLFVSYELWFINENIKRGPLCNCNNKNELSQVVLDLVKKYITENMIKLNLDAYKDGSMSTMYIYATISRKDVDNIKKKYGN